MQKKPFTSEEFKSIYSRVPRLTVDAVIKKDNGIVLSLRKEGIGWENMWHLPGGTVLYKETVEQALHRIVKDETGLDIRVLKLLGYMEYPEEEKERGFGWSVSIAILCEALPGDLVVNEDASDIRVYSELPEGTIKTQRDFLEIHWGEIFEK